MTSQTTSRPSPPPLPARLRVNIFALMIAMAGFGLVLGIGYLMVYYLPKALAEYLVNNLEINDSFVGKLIALVYVLGFSVFTVMFVILDGEEKKIRGGLHQFFSELVVRNYRPASGQGAAGAGQPDQGSARAAASVRPKADALEDDYKQGRLNGTYREYFPNGVLKKEAHYIDGKITGLFRTYYENAQIEQEAVYRDGRIDGLYKAYYDNGIPHQEKIYKDGKLNGVHRAYDEKGILFFEISYKDDVQEGTDKIYDQSGVLQFMDTYRSGICVNRKTYDEFGVLKYDQNFEEEMDAAQRTKVWENAMDRETLEKEMRRQRK
ncbi:MAG: toxin-antitoxin system YwqK family antitoxin [Candidatus Omnitrophota bacterium]|nr:toxin-antitoxin system YwqK family antitoxin [Candidatus Omnitrophota bacterium]MDZ4242260.1 toxin-antitoxin system YwqK family antitoxin [Candidatus Omnitrophota bacterium]